MVKLACNTGLKRGEILNLKWKDIDFENRILYIIKNEDGKASKVKLNHTAIDTLNKIKRHPKSEYVFCDSEGNKYFSVRKSFNTALQKAGQKTAKQPSLQSVDK
ncbi:MAG: tyrosine-type recombinase/integrase [bacterium]